MVQATFHFPQGFLWGTATSSYQVEGFNTNNQWWCWEQQPGKIINGDKSGAACGWWSGRWREDFDRAAEGGQNALRFSIEWSRVQPVAAHWDETAIDRYREMARRLQARGMTALVTLHHFSDPIWLADEGGWENPAVVDRFATYTRKVVESLKEYVNLWITINEPNAYACSSYLSGEFPPGEQSLKKTGTVLAHMARAHAAAYQVIKEIQPKARVGIACHFRGMQPAHNWSPLDRLAIQMIHRYYHDSFPEALVGGVLNWPFNRQDIPEAKGTLDFIGLNYFAEELVSFRIFMRALFQGGFDITDELNDDSSAINHPEGLFRALKWCRGFNLPILITANGINDVQDNLRPEYLVSHLHQVWRAITFSFPIQGYFHWSLVDNFDWESGWSKRYGLWELDLDTQKRRMRQSAELYREICRSNAISSEVVNRYTPELVERLFPV